MRIYKLQTMKQAGLEWVNHFEARCKELGVVVPESFSFDELRKVCKETPTQETANVRKFTR